MSHPVAIEGFSVGQGHPLLVIAGPCVIESPALIESLASFLKAETSRLGLNLIFKASYDKANRTSIKSFRGPGLQAGLEMLATVRREIGVPIISDVHALSEVEVAARVLDVIQIPAFLCRQTDLIQAVAGTGKVINIKKGQFISPWDIEHIIEKITAAGGDKIVITERGTSFGYNNLVVDMRSLPIMRSFGYPVIFDATHSVQLPGGGRGSSGGDSRFIAPLARAAVAAGVDGVFMEVHPKPQEALCDGPNSLPQDQLPALLRQLQDIDRVLNAGD